MRGGPLLCPFRCSGVVHTGLTTNLHDLRRIYTSVTSGHHFKQQERPQDCQPLLILGTEGHFISRIPRYTCKCLRGRYLSSRYSKPGILISKPIIDPQIINLSLVLTKSQARKRALSLSLAGRLRKTRRDKCDRPILPPPPLLLLNR